MISSLSWVLGTDVTFIIETAILQTNTGHRYVGNVVVDWFLYDLAQPMEGGLH